MTHGAASGFRLKYRETCTSIVYLATYLSNKLSGTTPRTAKEVLSKFQPPFLSAEIGSRHPSGRVVGVSRLATKRYGIPTVVAHLSPSGLFSASTLTIFLLFAFFSAFYRCFQGQVPGEIDSGRKSNEFASGKTSF